MASLAKENVVLPGTMGGGPHGLGDPDDKSLRHVETEILIPQKMKEKAKKERCAKEVKDFGDCAKDQGVLLPFMCRAVAKHLEQCLTASYKDPAFKEKCKEEYLEERSEYRRTGIKKKMKKKDAVIS
ncbi:hypothetical protein C0Q70_07571 [Pomacea canaliculata]|uniref:COX assembly mitochondrial protein n=1 Tax=Pomacea canaliculata TaxID=400727 RepID=A0A2T7PFE2_POMCA|nr:COX assembly mitochondrial protein homolog [Pomacea canaliculata]PVD32142.1 hypothetical protein C0Q70_07571 [Pomacea canaliculata]